MKATQKLSASHRARTRSERLESDNANGTNRIEKDGEALSDSAGDRSISPGRSGPGRRGHRSSCDRQTGRAARPDRGTDDRKADRRHLDHPETTLKQLRQAIASPIHSCPLNESASCLPPAGCGLLPACRPSRGLPRQSLHGAPPLQWRRAALAGGAPDGCVAQLAQRQRPLPG